MHLPELASGAAALVIAVPHALADGIAAVARFIGWHKPAATIPTTTKEATMSETTAPAATSQPATVFDTIRSIASRAVEAMTLVSDDWSAIKANPLYGALATAAVAAAKTELASKGIPVAGVVNVELAVEGMLNALAAAHPVINTPPQAAPAS